MVALLWLDRSNEAQLGLRHRESDRGDYSMLRGPIERGRDGEGSAYRQHNEAQQTGQPSENEAEVVADSGEDDVGGVVLGSLEVAAAGCASVFMRPMTVSMAERRRSPRLMIPKTPRF